MASFFSKFFGGGSGRTGQGPTREDPVTFEGLEIQAAPQPSEGQWRLAGYIIKRTADGDLERHFLRADLFASRDEACDFSVRKGRQIISEQGDSLFANGAREGRA